MNCLYPLGGGYHFNGNTTAFIEMEDGVTEYGLAVGLTFVCPKITGAGFHAGMLVRYLLEKCKTAAEVIQGTEHDGFVVAANTFVSPKMKRYTNPEVDDWHSDERYFTV